MPPAPPLIVRADPAGPAARLGLGPGCRLVAINGVAVPDDLAARFQAAAERIRLTWLDPQGVEHQAELRKGWDEALGLELEALKMRACNNKCVFCFAHQNPRGVRRALSFKDDDFRFSFLHGNFATLTNLTARDLARIIAQRLSPLYVSVHATDHGLRNFLLQNPQAPDILEQIAELARGRITMHCQIVLCPDLNDGPPLEKSLADLSAFHPWVATVALVPVGLTVHRDRLFPVKPVTPAYARDLVGKATGWRRRYRRTLGTRFAFPSDEFYLLAGLPFPAARAYEGFPQLENGVGPGRRFQDDFRRLARGLPPALERPRRVLAVTGRLAHPVLAPASERLARVGNLEVRLRPVPNRFFGESVGCAGLLVGADILTTIQGEAGWADEVLVPSVAFKRDEDLFLDDCTLADLARALGRPVRRVEATGAGLVRAALGAET